jgi:hypothetical protein
MRPEPVRTFFASLEKIIVKMTLGLLGTALLPPLSIAGIFSFPASAAKPYYLLPEGIAFALERLKSRAME